MAFVFRSDKKSLPKNYQHPGPASYDINLQKQNKISKAFVPFGSMEPKISDKIIPNENPGPGTYNINAQHNGQKIIVSSQTQDVKIIEISKPHPVFKSGTKRFQDRNQEIIQPGPGDYNIDSQIRNKAYSMGNNNVIVEKPKILQHLININNYQSIPSIPSNIHAYGYNVNDDKQLELNQPPVVMFKGQKNDNIGPGQYEIKINSIKNKSISWSQNKSKKNQEIKTNTYVGPGTYQNKTSIPLYNFKPSCQFASKTLRSMDQRKGAIINQKNNQITTEKINQTPMQSRVSSQKAVASTQLEDSDDSDEYQYIQQTTPGPGSYLEISEIKKFKTGKTNNTFGISSKRFTNNKNTTGNIGPGDYNINKKFKKIKNTKRIIQQKIQQRCPLLTQTEKIKLPAPNAYQPRNTMQDKLIYKIQRGYRGQFGSTEIRSKEIDYDELPGPGYYEPLEIIEEKKQLAIFKSKTKKQFMNKIQSIPAPGSYNIINQNIATRIIKQQQDDPDLIIHKPGFGVGQDRFKEINKKNLDFDDDDIIKQIQEKYNQEKKKKQLKNSVQFKSKQPRIIDIKNNNPAPGAYYDGQEDHWNKRTYNILFADI